MNPTIEARLDSMIRALSDIVLPELSAGSLAQEQAGLVLGHLQVIRSQFDFSASFERAELASIKVLARELAAAADGGQTTNEAARALADSASAIDGDTPSKYRANMEEISNCIENLYRAADVDGEVNFKRKMKLDIIRQSAEWARYQRIWFSSMGFEARNSDLPSVGQLISQLSNHADSR